MLRRCGNFLLRRLHSARRRKEGVRHAALLPSSAPFRVLRVGQNKSVGNVPYLRRGSLMQARCLRPTSWLAERLGLSVSTIELRAQGSPICRRMSRWRATPSATTRLSPGVDSGTTEGRRKQTTRGKSWRENDMLDLSRFQAAVRRATFSQCADLHPDQPLSYSS